MYKFNPATLNCEMKCSAVPAPAPAPPIPGKATDLAGVDWPSECHDEEDEVTFFSIGDWGGICGWPNYDHADPTADLCATPDFGGRKFYRPGWGIPQGQGIIDGMPFPMDTYKRMSYVDLNAQVLIADKMTDKYDELKKAGQPPRFVINVGDSIYPGGIEEHCSNKGAGDIDAISKMYQWQAVFEKVYKSADADYNKIPWMGVLGNHDYGGNCYVKAWDQLIYYTWAKDGRWMIPAQYWKRTMQFKRFAVEIFFIDGNVNDVSPADNDPKHNICYRHGNDNSPDKEDHCFWGNHDGKGPDYPPSNGAGVACPKTNGPYNPDDCVGWFTKLWAANLAWLTKGLEASTAEWQIVVSHYPVLYNRNMVWETYAKEHGIDLIITGHQHRQEVYNHKPMEQKYDARRTDMGGTVHVVTGGGGGIQTDAPPNADGNDDTYGYMVMKLQINKLTVEAWTHGGKLLKNGGKHVLRNTTSAPPVLRGGASLVV